MPYQQTYKQPSLERLGSSVWRYLPWYKFADLLESRSLFFTRLRHIVEREMDVNEGALAPVNYTNPQVNVDWFLGEMLPPGQSPDTVVAAQRQYGDVGWLRENENWNIDNSYVSCWFTNEFESEKMWAEYVPDGYGVVVQSTIRGLPDSFNWTSEAIDIQPITYYDPASGTMVPPHPFRSPFHKHCKWKEERELRCLVVGADIPKLYSAHPANVGVWVPVDLAILVQRVRVAPGADTRLLGDVRRLIRKAKLNPTVVERSRLEGGPDSRA